MDSTFDPSQQLPPDDVAAIDELGKTYQAFREELGKIIIGQDEVIERELLAGVECRIHDLRVEAKLEGEHVLSRRDMAGFGRRN